MFSFLLLGQISVISFVNFSRFSWCGMLCSLWWQMFANCSLNLQHKLLILVCDCLTRLLCGHGSWVAHFRGAGRAQTFSADSDQTTMSWSKSSVDRTHFYVHHSAINLRHGLFLFLWSFHFAFCLHTRTYKNLLNDCLLHSLPICSGILCFSLVHHLLPTSNSLVGCWWF